MHFIQRKQFIVTNLTSHNSDLKIFAECVRGPLKMLCGGPHVARGPPLIAQPWTNLQYIELQQAISVCEQSSW